LELFELSPNIKLKHCLVEFEPTILKTSDIEAWNGKDARNDGAQANEDSKFNRFFNGVKIVVTSDGFVTVRGKDAEDGNEEEEH